MSDRQLVSVLTPTWQRHDLLMAAIENVRHQTYRPLEHVVVSDGPDHELMNRIYAEKLRQPCPIDDERYVSLRFLMLGRNWSSILPASFAAPPIIVAQLTATGSYHHFLADDETMAPDHIESLVAAMSGAGADFAYSKVNLYWPDGPTRTIGTDPPQEGQITNALYRADLIRRAGLYPLGAGMTSDWEYVRRWMAVGATWAFVERVTLQHRVDH